MSKSGVKANGWRRHATGLIACGWSQPCCICAMSFGGRLADSVAASHRARAVR